MNIEHIKKKFFVIVVVVLLVVSSGCSSIGRRGENAVAGGAFGAAVAHNIIGTIHPLIGAIAGAYRGFTLEEDWEEETE